MQNLHLFDGPLKKCPIFFRSDHAINTERPSCQSKEQKISHHWRVVCILFQNIYPSKNLKNSDQPTRNIHNHLFTRHKQMPKTQDISTLLILALNEINQLFGSPGMAKPLLLVLPYLLFALKLRNEFLSQRSSQESNIRGYIFSPEIAILLFCVE